MHTLRSPGSHLIMVSWTLSLQPEQHFHRFIRFCRDHGRDKQTDIPTDHATPSAVIDRILCRACYAALWQF